MNGLRETGAKRLLRPEPVHLGPSYNGFLGEDSRSPNGFIRLHAVFRGLNSFGWLFAVLVLVHATRSFCGDNGRLRKATTASGSDAGMNDWQPSLARSALGIVL